MDIIRALICLATFYQPIIHFIVLHSWYFKAINSSFVFSFPFCMLLTFIYLLAIPSKYCIWESSLVTVKPSLKNKLLQTTLHLQLLRVYMFFLWNSTLSLLLICEVRKLF